MTLEEAKALLDKGQTLELHLPSTSAFLGRNYHIWLNQGHYTITVLYSTSRVYQPLFASTDWADFFQHVPPVCQNNNEWMVL